MFNSVLVRRRASLSSSADAGVLAEALLFYNKIHLLVDYFELASWIEGVGAYNLIELLDRKFLTISYSKNITVTNCPTSFNNFYSFENFPLKNEYGKVIPDLTVIEEVVTNGRGASKDNRRIARDLIDRFAFREVGFGHARSAADVVTEQLLDKTVLREQIMSLLRDLVPRYTLPPDWHFMVIPNDDRFSINTNLDFEAISAALEPDKRNIEGKIPVSTLLRYILEAKINVDLASDYMTELAVDAQTSNLIRLRFQRLLSRRDRSDHEIALFQEVHLGNARAIREAIASGEKTFSDFLPILDKSRRFKDWLSEENPDANLLHEYYRMATSDSWIASLPAKIVRFVIATAVGFTGPLAGVVAGAADEFLVDRILKGWRPNQFIDGPVKDFLSAS
jgi:hypothetical protein